MGSKVATKGLGFIYAVTLGGYLGDYKPGDRANSHISPTLISKNNTPVLALGAAGGSRIITAVTQVASRYIDQNNTLEKSLMLPRVYPFEDSLWIEDHSGVKELNAELNIITNPYKMIDEIARFGRVHAVAIDSINKKWIGAADPDWEGTTEINEK
jgi:gamma-glutamyltranspeptidase/glutathione hydrolase